MIIVQLPDHLYFGGLNFNMEYELMSYIAKTLTPDEKVEVTAKLHWFCYRWVILWCILAIPSCGITLIFAFIAWLKISTVVMVCTNKRCVCREGILRVNVNELKNKKIESVELKYTLLGNIFKYADLYISGTGTSKVIFKSIGKPWEIKAAIEKVIGE